jgi:predicted transcriptional regulator
MKAGTSSERRRAARARYSIRTAREVALLASPARQEIVDGLQALGPVSLAELGEALGRAPDSLYYHVRMLLKAGLVVPRGTRGAGVREEALYDTPGALVIDHEPATPRESEGLMRLVGSALRAAERDLRAAFEGGLAVYRRVARRNAWGARTKGWLTREELTEARGHLEAVSELLARGRRRRGASLHTITFVLAPVAPGTRTQRKRKEKE